MVKNVIIFIEIYSAIRLKNIDKLPGYRKRQHNINVWHQFDLMKFSFTVYVFDKDSNSCMLELIKEIIKSKERDTSA